MPAYNEVAELPRTVGKLIPALERLAVAFEIVIVNDGSQDATGELVDSIASRDSRVQAFHHPTNLGVGAALATAMRFSRGEFFLFVPADLAMEPDAIGRYLAAAQDADIVAGFTGARPDYNLFRSLVSWTNGTLLRLLFHLPIRNFNYSHLYRLSLLRQIRLQFIGSAMLYAEIFVKAKRLGARIVQIPVPYVPRAGGKATGAKPSLILRTGRDMIRLWLLSVTGRLRD
jgi:Glycosyltransferases involved in cell wall biogenesis